METRVATASPEAGTLACGTARRPRRDGRACGGVPQLRLSRVRPPNPGVTQRRISSCSGQATTCRVTTRPCIEMMGGGIARMSEPHLGPLRFHPILRRLIWGGRRLGTVLGKPLGEHGDYAESWEISDYRDAVSVVSEGPLEGKPLR